jgi:hypothetical protein
MHLLWCSIEIRLNPHERGAKSEQKMPKLHMTDVVVSRRKFNGTYYDEMTPAFGLRVGKNRKTWLSAAESGCARTSDNIRRRHSPTRGRKLASFLPKSQRKRTESPSMRRTISTKKL